MGQLRAPARLKMTPRRLLVASAFLLAILLLLAAGFLLDRQIRSLETSADWVKHSGEVELTISRLADALDNAESGVRGLVLSGNLDYLAPYYRAASDIEALLRSLESLTADNPDQQANLARLRPLVASRLDLMRTVVATYERDPGRVTSALPKGHGKAVMDEVHGLLDGMTKLEEELLNEREQKTDAEVGKAERLAQAIAVLGVLSLGVASSWLALATHRRGLAERRSRQLARSLDERRIELERAIAERGAADSLRQTRERQLEQERQLAVVGRLAAGLAHVLNNILTTILGNAELIAESPRIDAETRSSAVQVQESALRAARLTGLFQSFGQEQLLRPELVDAAVILRDLRDFAVTMLGGGIALELRGEPGGCPILADRSQLWAALINILTNAKEAMPKGGRLVLAARRLPAGSTDVPAAGDPDQVEISIADNGHGMAEDVRRQAFDPFFTTKHVSEGAGLGLSMVYGFVRQSGGEVALRSEPGQGTEVVMRFPAAEAGTQPPQAAS